MKIEFGKVASNFSSRNYYMFKTTQIKILISLTHRARAYWLLQILRALAWDFFYISPWSPTHLTEDRLVNNTQMFIDKTSFQRSAVSRTSLSPYVLKGSGRLEFLSCQICAWVRGASIFTLRTARDQQLEITLTVSVTLLHTAGNFNSNLWNCNCLSRRAEGFWVMATAKLNVRVASCCHFRYFWLFFKNHSSLPYGKSNWGVKLN